MFTYEAVQTMLDVGFLLCVIAYAGVLLWFVEPHPIQRRRDWARRRAGIACRRANLMAKGNEK